MSNIVIREDFKNLIPPLSENEYKQLEQNVLADGIRDPLVLWGNVLVDGHNRYGLAQKHNLPFQTVSKDFADDDEAIIWIMQNQLGRRNLNDFQRVEIAYKCEDAVKAKAIERQESTRFGGEGNISLTVGQSRDELGNMAGVSGKTYEHGVAVIEKAPEPVVKAARNNEISINAAYEVTKMPVEKQNHIAERIERGEDAREVIREVKNSYKDEADEESENEVDESDDWMEDEYEPNEYAENQGWYELNEILQEYPFLSEYIDVHSEPKPKPHVSYNSGNNEWYTPAEYIEAARNAMGTIDLDPASSDIAQEVVNAKTYYTIETNGLDKPWRGNIWLNPPYSSDSIVQFIDKLVEERPYYQQAIVLVNNATETEWFNKLISIASAVCFLKSRVKFYMPDGKTGAPLQGQAMVYIGNRPTRFSDSCANLGWRCMGIEL